MRVTRLWSRSHCQPGYGACEAPFIQKIYRTAILPLVLAPVRPLVAAQLDEEHASHLVHEVKTESFNVYPSTNRVKCVEEWAVMTCEWRISSTELLSSASHTRSAHPLYTASSGELHLLCGEVSIWSVLAWSKHRSSNTVVLVLIASTLQPPASLAANTCT